ncbi:MAG: 30S ribosomal protein S11 [bacterium]
MIEENIEISQPATGPAIEPKAETEEKTASTKEKKTKGRRKKKIIRQVTSGRVYIQATYNNTLITLTDQSGNVLANSSAGLLGFKGPKKSTPYAATMIIQDVAEKVQKVGLKDVNVFVNGVGSGREAAIRALNANGFNVLQIRDVTPIPHNGCRPKKPRRV